MRVVKVKRKKESANNTRAENVRKGYVWSNLTNLVQVVRIEKRVSKT